MRVKSKAMPLRLLGMAVFATVALSLFGGGTAKAAELSATPENITSVIAGAEAGDTVQLEAAGDNGVAYSYGGFTVDKAITIDGNDAIASGIVKVTSGGVTIKDINFHANDKNSESAIQVRGNINGLTISGNNFTGYKGWTIDMSSGTYSNVTITHNTDDNQDKNNITLVESGAASSLRIANNTFGSTVRIDGYDILTTDVDVSGNIFNTIPDTAISVVEAKNVTISDNVITTMDSNVYTNIAVGQVIDVEISGNTIAGSGKNIAISVTTKDYGEHTVGIATGVVVADNQIKSSNTAVCIDGAGDIELMGNNLTDLTVGVQVGKGGEGNIGDITITGSNTISANKAILVTENALADDSVVYVSAKAAISGSVSDNTQVVYYDFDLPEPTPEDPGQGGDVADEGQDNNDTPAVTEPVEEDSADNTDVTAPNTGIATDATSGATDGASILTTITTALAMLVVLAGIRIAAKEND